MRAIEVVMLALALLYACNQYGIVKDEGSETAGADDEIEEEEDTSMWDGATLVVDSPASGAFLPYEDPATFSATVYDVNGVASDFADIQWVSNIDEDWIPVGNAFDDDSLGVGTHALTATAVLPNGNRLAWTNGGILVQSIYTGVYTGTLSVAASGDYNGTPVSVGCSGAVTLVIDVYGEEVTGDAGCLISLFSYEIDTAYVFDLENDDGELSGDANVDLVITEYAMATEGEVTEEGELEGEFAEDVFGYLALDGSYNATRVSRDVSEYEE